MVLEGAYYDNNLRSVYIQQDDVLFAQLTTKETLETSYDLSVASQKTSSQSQGVVWRMLNDLGLRNVADTKVGDVKTRGLSGGEKKRLCIGNEIIADPEADEGTREKGLLIFADEPTSGLDCFQVTRFQPVHPVTPPLTDETYSGDESDSAATEFGRKRQHRNLQYSSAASEYLCALRRYNAHVIGPSRLHGPRERDGALLHLLGLSLSAEHQSRRVLR